MANIIRIKRGLKENLPTLLVGELAFCTDTNELFVGKDTGNVLVNDLSDLENYFTKAEIEDLAGTGLSWNSGTEKFDIDNPFNPSGTFADLRAQATTAADVGLGNVTNESKATMFSSPTFTGTVTIASQGSLTGVPTPSVDLDAANKAYVDQVAQGIKSRTQAQVFVEDNLPGTYNSVPELHEFTSSTNGAFPSVDGVDSEILNVEGARIVLAGQSNPAHNGLYVLKTEGDASNPWVLRRCTECDTSEKIPGSFVFVTKGDDYANTGWVFEVDSPSAFVLGTDPINVIQFSGAGTFTAGTGLDLDGTIFSLADNYGDTKNPYASKTSKHFLAAPNATNGAPTFRAIVASDIPTLNQNTTGTAANVTGTVAIGNGGTGATTAAGARTSLGASTIGANLFTLTNPGAVRFPRFNADNTISSLTAADFRTAIGAGTSSTVGTVTSVSGTGTVSGLTLTGTVTASGNLTLGGTLSVTGANFGSQTANRFLGAPNGSNGNPTFRALVAADIPNLDTAKITSGTFVDARIPNLDTGKITSGTLPLARGGTGRTDGRSPRWVTARTFTVGSTGKSVTGAANVSWTLAEIGAAATSHTHAASAITSGTFVDARIPNLNASKITAGTLPVARGGTGRSTLTSNTVLVGNGTSAVTLASRSGIDTRSTFPPASHTHGALLNNGTITTNTTIGNNARFAIIDTSNRLRRSTLTFGTGTGTFLANNGTWQAASIPSVISSTSDFAYQTTSHRREISVSENSGAGGTNAQVTASNSSRARGSNSQISASGFSRTSGGTAYTQINASFNSYTGYGAYHSQVNASRNSTTDSSYTQVNASINSTASGYRSQVNASEFSFASGYRSQINAGYIATANGFMSQVNAGRSSTASEYLSQVNAGYFSTANGFISQVNASANSTANGSFSQVNVSTNSTASGYLSQVNASRYVTSSSSYAVVQGTSNTQRIRLESDTGVGRFRGGTSTSGFDFAELFENGTEKEIEPGKIVTIKASKVEPAQEDDRVVGVVSHTYGFLGNGSDMQWEKAELRDEWGRVIMEEVKNPRYRLEKDFLKDFAEKHPKTIIVDEMPEEKEKGKIYRTREELYKGHNVVKTEEEIPLITQPKQNPLYDPDRNKDYKARVDRPDEWTPVGLLGQVYVRVNQDAKAGDNITAWKDGVGKPTQEHTNIFVIEITQEYDNEKEYAIAKCLLK